MADVLTVHVPMTFRRHGGRKLIVTPDGDAMAVAPSRTQIDNILLKALTRAVRWQRLLDQGTCSTIKEIASREKIDPSYVGDVLRLTLLAPDIVEMILDGRQPPTLQFESLRKSLPLSWEEQRSIFLAPPPDDRLPGASESTRSRGSPVEREVVHRPVSVGQAEWEPRRPNRLNLPAGARPAR